MNMIELRVKPSDFQDYRYPEVRLIEMLLAARFPILPPTLEELSKKDWDSLLFSREGTFIRIQNPVTPELIFRWQDEENT